MSEIINCFLHTQNLIRLYHWRTKSYARHVASGTLYQKLDPLIDSFVETYQGKLSGKENRIRYKPFSLKFKELSDNDIVFVLNEFKSFLLNDLEKRLKTMKMKNTDLVNIRDEILANVNQTLYLFTFE